MFYYIMTWRTRNIKRHSKGKQTKRTKTKQQGGLFGISKKVNMTDLIKYLSDNGIEVSAHIDGITSPVKIKFPSSTSFIILEAVPQITADFLNKPINITVSSSVMNSSIKIGNTAMTTKAGISNKLIKIDDVDKYKDGITEHGIKLKQDQSASTEKALEAQNAIKDSAATQLAQNKVALSRQQEDNTYVVSEFKLAGMMGDLPVIEFAKLPYTDATLKYLYYCIDKYLGLDDKTPITKESVAEFVSRFYDSVSTADSLVVANQTTLPIAQARIQLAIDVIKKLSFKTYFSEKGKLTEILSKLTAETVKRISKYEVGVECKSSMISKSDIFCFFVKCITYHDLGEKKLDSTTDISDIIKYGPDTGYDSLYFVSNGKDVESFFGCACVSDKNDEIRISYMVMADNQSTFKDSAINKLKDSVSAIFNGKKLIHLPADMNDKVNQELYSKIESEVDDGMATWTKKELVAEPVVETSIVETSIDVPVDVPVVETPVVDGTNNVSDKITNTPIPDKTTEDKNEVKEDDTSTIINEKVRALLAKLMLMYKPKETPTAETTKSTDVSTVPTDTTTNTTTDTTDTTESTVPTDTTTNTTTDTTDTTESTVPTDTTTNTTDTTDTTESTVPTDTTVSAEAPAVSVSDLEESKEQPEAPDNKIEDNKTEIQIGGNQPEIKTMLDELISTLPENVATELKPEIEQTMSVVENSTVKYEPNDPELITITSDISNIKDTINTNSILEEPLPEDTTPDIPPAETSTEATANTVDTPVVATQPETVDTPVVATQPETVVADEVTTETEPVVADEVTTVVPNVNGSDEPLTLDSLKVSPIMKHPTTGESGQYIYVPSVKVQDVIDYLLSNGCEVTTVEIK
jgi:hypothetical protein